MTKYLLQGWRKAIEDKARDEVNLWYGNPKVGIAGCERQAWYYICNFITDEIKRGNMIPEFEVFAHAYAREKLSGEIRIREHYKPTSSEIAHDVIKLKEIKNEKDKSHT